MSKLCDKTLLSLQAQHAKSTELIYGPADSRTLTMLHSLGNVYRWIGNTEKAIEIFQDLLQRQKALKTEHIVSKLEILSDLGAAHASRWQYEQAINVLMEAWEGRKREFGNSNLLSLKTQDLLAKVYQSQGKFQLAERMYCESLALRMSVDPHHPETLVVANNLGLLYRTLKKWKESETLLRKVVCGREILFGKENVATLWAVHHLGTLFIMQQRWEEGIE